MRRCEGHGEAMWRAWWGDVEDMVGRCGVHGEVMWRAGAMWRALRGDVEGGVC